MPFPLSCTLGLIAILAFLAAEICHPVRELPIEESEAEDTSAELYPAWETAEV